MNRRIIFIMIVVVAMTILSLPVSAAETSSFKNEEASSGATDSDTTPLKSATETAALASLVAGDDAGVGSVGKSTGISPLLSESFQTDLATGSATVSLPIGVPPGRKNMQPTLALTYSSNNPNSICGVGWELSNSSIQRSTKKGVPKYDDTDTIVFSANGSSGELALVDANTGEYRQKIETGFMKYIYDAAGSKWTVYDKMGTKYTFGSVVGSRLTNSDQTKTFAWYLDRVDDVYGNAVIFTYEKDGGQIYPSKVEYTENTSVTPALTADKSILLIYEARSDAVHNYRSGWDIQTAKRLKEVQVKADNALAWRYVLDYGESIDTKRSLLTQITLFDASGNSLPPKKFKYQTIE